MQESKSIWFNGELVPWHEAKVHVLTHALHYGSGVFEGIRAYPTARGPAILALEEHVDRLFLSCKVIELQIAWDKAEIRDAIVETVRANGHDSCYIRPLAFRGYGELGVMPNNNPTELIIASFPWGSLHGNEAIENGIDVGVSSWRRMAPNTHPAMAKVTGNYVNSSLVVAEALANGYQEGIVLDIDGFVSEGSGENIFLTYQGDVYTTPVSASILPGITRGIAMQLLTDRGVVVKEQRFAREMLYYADEIFLTGTAAEITPVKSVDKRIVGDGKVGELTRSLQNEFFGIVRGEAEDRHGWLTIV
ncbi:MAG: branched-chain amino acid transaminase [bacterium]|nr:branched-chain amino acid transaminase [bacterium]